MMKSEIQQIKIKKSLRVFGTLGCSRCLTHLDIKISGSVQGVNFRNMTKRFCDKIGIYGYVTNKTNGGVLIIAQGTQTKLNNLISWIKTSPGFSKVEDIKIEKQKSKSPEKKFTSFTILKEEYLAA